jgi:hypothetical protein
VLWCNFARSVDEAPRGVSQDSAEGPFPKKSNQVRVPGLLGTGTEQVTAACLVAGRLVAGCPVAGGLVAGGLVAGCPVAGGLVAGGLVAGAGTRALVGVPEAQGRLRARPSVLPEAMDPAEDREASFSARVSIGQNGSCASTISGGWYWLGGFSAALSRWGHALVVERHPADRLGGFSAALRRC